MFRVDIISDENVFVGFPVLRTLVGIPTRLRQSAASWSPRGHRAVTAWWRARLSETHKCLHFNNAFIDDRRRCLSLMSLALVITRVRSISQSLYLASFAAESVYTGQARYTHVVATSI